jgi:plasmid stabilization system protein ParE
VKRVRFHDEARAEIVREALYYDATSKALAERFSKAVEHAVALASQFPEMGARDKYGTRRLSPRRFPFSLVYVERRDEIYVLALAPFSRKPGYWRSRLSTIR